MDAGTSINTVAAVNPAHLAAPEFALAFALLTIGVARNPEVNGGEVVEFREEKNGATVRRFVFAFDPKGIDGVDTSTWVKRWNDEAWLKANPGHVFAAMRAYARTQADFARWLVPANHDPIFVFRRSVSGSSDGLRERLAYVPASLLDTERGHDILRRAGIAA